MRGRRDRCRAPSPRQLVWSSVPRAGWPCPTPRHDGGDEAFEPFGEDVGCDPEAALEVAEPRVSTEQRVPQDEQAPPLAGDLEDAGGGAFLRLVEAAEHGANVGLASREHRILSWLALGLEPAAGHRLAADRPWTGRDDGRASRSRTIEAISVPIIGPAGANQLFM